MSTNSTLEEMGIQNPNQITHYTLNQIDTTDHLRIFYKRKKGSILPQSKLFKFGRAEKMVMVDGGTGKTQTKFEISPIVLKAINELNKIVDDNQNKSEIIKQLEQQVTCIEEDLVTQLATVRGLIDKIK